MSLAAAITMPITTKMTMAACSQIHVRDMRRVYDRPAVADAQPTHAGSLAARAQEILRRADAQLAALRPAPPEPPAAEERAEAPSADPDRPPVVKDLGELLDTVEAGVQAARAHLVALSASVERIAEEITRVAEEQRLALPPQLAEHARLPDTRPREEPAAEEEQPAAEAPAVAAPREPTDAAHDAARLVAVEMAVAGDSREIVGRRLRDEFGISNPGPLLDDAFGPDTSGGRRGYRG